MKLAADDMRLFEIACGDPENVHAQELLNVFAVETAAAVLEQLSTAPLGVMADLFTHLWRAVEREGIGWSVSFEVVEVYETGGMSIAD
ncbi:MAG: hypothetical protein ACXVIJ_01195 [Thermoanaerobaculia bacterium]